MRFLASLLSQLILLNPLLAQTGSTKAVAAYSSDPLHVHVVDNPAPAIPKSTSPKGYIVQVTNTAGAPVANAAVALRLPEDGPTGRFANGLRAWVAYSDAAGIVRFPKIEWGNTPGEVEVKVTAVKGTLHTGLTIAQQIIAEPQSVSVVTVPVEAAASGPAPKPAPPPQPQVAVSTPAPGSQSLPLADTAPPANLSNMNRSMTGASPAPPAKLKPNPPPPSKETEPKVSITNSTTGASGTYHESHKKVYILLAVGAGAGAAAILALLHAHGGGAAGGSSSSGVTIGSPTVSVGH